MVILQAGVPKSGNLWLYRTLRSIATRTPGFESRSFIRRQRVYAEPRTGTSSFDGEDDVDFLEIERRGCYFRFRTMRRFRITDVDDYVRKASHVWTHSAVIERSLSVVPRFDKVVYLIRDPRDVAVSLSRFMFSPHVTNTYPSHERDPASYLDRHFDAIVRHWVAHVGGYLAQLRAFRMHVVFYERLRSSFESELQALLDYLGVRLDDAAVGDVLREVEFDRMKEKDPFHVRSGAPGEWRTVLSGDQQRLAGQLSGKMLRLLGYPSDSLPGALPSLPESLDPRDIELAVADARRNVRDHVARALDLIASDAPLGEKVRRVRRWLP